MSEREETEHANFCLRWGVPSTVIASSLDPTAIEFPDYDIREKMGGGKLSESRVEEILRECRSGKSQNQVAREVGVSPAMVSMIINKKRRNKTLIRLSSDTG